MVRGELGSRFKDGAEMVENESIRFSGFSAGSQTLSR